MADSRYRIVRSIRHVSPGDQIAVELFNLCIMSYYHQAIVESVDANKDTFTVIEKLPGGVRRSVYYLFSQEVWKINNPEREFTAQEVIDRARSRITEVNYNLQHENCEHFTEWCVTNIQRAPQVDNMNRILYHLLPLVDSWWSFKDYF